MVAVAGLLVGVLSTSAFAQLEETAARRAACMGDALMLCSSAITISRSYFYRQRQGDSIPCGDC